MNPTRFTHYQHLLWTTHYYAVQHYPCSIAIAAQVHFKLALDAARALGNGRLALDADLDDVRRVP